MEGGGAAHAAEWAVPVEASRKMVMWQVRVGARPVLIPHSRIPHTQRGEMAGEPIYRTAGFRGHLVSLELENLPTAPADGHGPAVILRNAFI
jgi:hypothetical protein